MSTSISVPAVAVSGASAGIGLATAEFFAKHGWRVSIAARTEKDLAQIHERWAASYPKQELLTYVADLTNAAETKQWAAAIEQKFGQLDVLVHNLGHFQPGTLLDGPADQLADFFAVNVVSAHQLTRACLPILKQAGKAQMITIGSVATTDWPAPLAAYSLSKYALEGWHREVSKELQTHNIRTTLVRPGATFTRSWDGVEIDPNTLLSAQQVAEQVGRAVLNAEREYLEEITIRPASN